MPLNLSKHLLPGLLIAATAIHSAPALLAIATLDLPGGDLSGLTAPVESGLPGNNFWGIGSGLAWAGGNKFLAVPDRGPNATTYTNGPLIDNTTSYIARVRSLDLNLSAVPSGSLPYTLTASLTATTLLYSETPLIYGATAGLPGAVPASNTATKNYFTGRSDNFGPGLSTDPDFARIDPEAIRLSRDGKSVFIADEYGPYVYQFERSTGKRIRSLALPNHFAISNLFPVGAAEISGNTSGRVTNKGMEGLAITPDGKTLVGFVQSPLIQDGGDGGRANRIVTIDIASGATHEYVYDNLLTVPVVKTYNSSEILALNNHQFLVLERDGKGLGDGSKAVIKQLYSIDIAGATDVSGISGETNLLPFAPAKKLFLDMAAALKANGILDTQIPAKLEGIAIGQDIIRAGVVNHTLYVGNDNDFFPTIAGPNKFFVFAFTDADLAATNLSYAAQVFNVKPVADAGANTTLTSSQVSGTTLTGTVSDEDGDALSCRWLEGVTVLKASFPAAGGSCPLALSGLGLSIGTHVLTLEVNDSKDTAANDVMLSIGNSSPTVTAAGGGVYEVNTSVTLSGQVSDFDGDLLTFSWTVDGVPACSGNISAPAGGAPIALAGCTVSGLALGAHAALLTVSDGINAPVSADQSIEMEDVSAPTVAPVASPSILWPPMHQMVDVVIHANAADDGGIVNLSATVSSNEAQEGLGDGDTAGDWSEPMIDQASGSITLKLRAERSGRGNGRTYSVTVSAEDLGGNVSHATVAIKVPFNQSKK